MFSDGVSRRAAGRGFTLMELMITVGIVALLAAVAYPGYQSSVLKSRRSEAKAALTDAAQRLERYYTENNKYTGASFCTLGVGTCTTANQVYAEKSENGYYALQLLPANVTTTTFRASAIPQGAQANDPCGTFTLNQAGERSVTNASPGTDVTQCW